MFLSAALTLLLSLSAPAHATEGAPAARHEASAASDAAAAKKKAANKKSGKSGEGKGNGDGKKKGKGEKEPPGKIAAGEFENSARTLKKGAIVLSPLFMPSSYGISNKVQLLLPIAPQLLGPQVAVRYDFMNKKMKDLAVEPYASSDWSFSSVTAGANLRYTMEMKKNRLNLAAGAGFSTTLSKVENLAEDGTDSLSTDDIPSSGLAGINVEVGYDYVQNPKTVWRFKAGTDPYADAQGAASAVVAANWNHSLAENFRLGLGLAVYVGGSQERALLSKVGLDLSDHNVLPLPTIDLWWRL